MAQQTAASAAALRALTFRITSTPTKHLPKIALQIAGAIWTCRHLLSAPSDAKRSGDAQTAVHRFKTQLSTLLQDRTIEGRWAAVVLVKTTIEAGGAEVLSKSNAWVRSLLGILKRPDPPTTRNLVVLTLTRIFTLTWDHTTLIREITTPALTAFIPTCLSNLESKRCSSAERQTILDAFATLVPRHSTIFRTNEPKLRAILATIISSTASEANEDVHYDEEHRSSASKLWVLLLNCAPKSGGSEKWDEALDAVVKAVHATADRVFRAVQEEWQSVAGIESSVPHHALSAGEVESASDDAIGLKPWKGIYAGGERLVSLLELLETYISTASPGKVSVRLGHIADLLTRLFGVTVPIPGKTDFVKFNNQISQEERNAMCTVLPRVHIAAFEVAVKILHRLSLAAIPWAQTLLDQASYVFRAESTHPDLRLIGYKLFNAVLALAGPAMSRSDVADLDQILKHCCQDLLSNDEGAPPASADILEKSASNIAHEPDLGLISAAKSLLRSVLSKLDHSCIPPKTRVQIDRAAVLTRDKGILLSSVLNPPQKQNGLRVQASMLPVLAREFPDSPVVEALLRPRMPAIFAGSPKPGFEQAEDVEDESANEEAMDDLEEPDADPTTDLLDALTQDITDDSRNGHHPTGIDRSNKREADADATTSTSAKRLRASPIATSLLPESSSVLPELVPAVGTVALPETILAEGAQETATLPLESRDLPPNQTSSGRTTTGTSHDAASDDSDFEMPPLTMEPDTDDDEEEEEEK